MFLKFFVDFGLTFFSTRCGLFRAKYLLSRQVFFEKMQLKILQDFIEKYAVALRHDPPERLFVWETQQIWQSNFDLGALDLADNFDRSLENSVSRRLWHSEQFFPKKMMLEFLRRDPETLKAMFKDLFDETKLVENRLSRFAFGLDLMLAEWRDDGPARREMSHFHDDHRLASLYLSLQFPAEYAPYEFEILKKTLTKLGAANPPDQVHDPARWFKVARTLGQMLAKKPEIEASVKKWLHPRRHFQGQTILTVDDFARFICKS